MAELILYNFKKQRNSTAIPAGGASFSVELKRGTSLLRPVFLLSSDASIYGYSCAKFENRYYFVTNIISVRNNLWEVECAVDVLASYKPALMDELLYVVRATTESNGEIIDYTYPSLQGYQTDEQTLDPEDSPFFPEGGGCYIVGIIGDASAGSAGAVTYWAMTQTEFNSFNGDLLGDIDWYDVSNTEISLELQKMLFNPFQYIVSCYWFPFPVSSFSGESHSVRIGWWIMDTRAKRLSDTYGISKLFHFPIVDHPQIYRGTFLNAAPFTRRFLHMLPFGVIEIDPQWYYRGLSVSNRLFSFYLHVDIITGIGTLSTLGEYNAYKSYQVLNAQVGVPVQLAQVNLNGQGFVNTVANAGGIVTSGLTGNIPGAIAGGVAALGSAIDTVSHMAQSLGQNAGKYPLFTNVTLLSTFSLLADEDLGHRGRPLCTVKKLGELHGFTMCADADISISCTDTEKQMIIEFLQNGFYIE